MESNQDQGQASQREQYPHLTLVYHENGKRHRTGLDYGVFSGNTRILKKQGTLSHISSLFPQKHIA